MKLNHRVCGTNLFLINVKLCNALQVQVAAKITAAKMDLRSTQPCLLYSKQVLLLAQSDCSFSKGSSFTIPDFAKSVLHGFISASVWFHWKWINLKKHSHCENTKQNRDSDAYAGEVNSSSWPMSIFSVKCNILYG